MSITRLHFDEMPIKNFGFWECHNYKVCKTNMRGVIFLKSLVLETSEREREREKSTTHCNVGYRKVLVKSATTYHHAFESFDKNSLLHFWLAPPFSSMKGSMKPYRFMWLNLGIGRYICS